MKQIKLKERQIYCRIDLSNLKKDRAYQKKDQSKLQKMQNLSQNELNQIIKMHDQSRDELERIAKIRRIKNYEEMSKEELIISLLKSKSSLAEFFNNNLDNGKISDIKKILNRLRDVLPRTRRREIKKEFYEIENKKNVSELEKEEIKEYLTNLVRTLDKKRKTSSP